MRAVRAHRRGGPEVLRYEEAPVPAVGKDEVLVAVHAAGVTPGELAWDASWETADGRSRTPMIPAHECSGVVTGAGPGVEAPAPGDAVMALIDFHHDGAAADYVALPAATVVARPGRLSHTEAAALPLAGLTAWQALADHARLQRGERVLVQGGAGGVGSLAVQVAKALGAEVTATAQGDDELLVASLGAGRVVRSVEEARPPGAAPFDVVVNTFSGPVPPASYEVLRRGGRLVTLSGPVDASRAEAAGIEGTFFVVAPDPGALRHLGALADRGELRPVVARTLPLAEAAAAYGPAPTPRRPGKTVLVVRP